MTNRLNENTSRVSATIASFLHKISDYHDRLSLEVIEAYLSEIAVRENVIEVVPHTVYYESFNQAMVT